MKKSLKRPVDWMKAQRSKDDISELLAAGPNGNAVRASLKYSWIDTIKGDMLAIADDDSLLLFEFLERRGLEREIYKLKSATKSSIIQGACAPIDLIAGEVSDYFAGNLKEFKTPIKLFGTPFQKSVWQGLMQIPYGEQISYAELAKNIGRPKSFRAVANANGANQLAIIVPCHRVINSDGGLGGYGGGIANKEWLLKHEKTS